MAYAIDMEKAAYRHYEDGYAMLQNRRPDNAGYHFGLSTECVIKHVLLDNYRIKKSDAPWMAHFPDLRHAAELFLSNRAQAARLRTIIEDQNLMQGWHVKMRYARNSSVSPAQAKKWQEQAKNTLGLLIA
ncbi:hypothetical protein [Bordetella genomosp. 1]|uniref:hypothetical protein n=1 Tax=Bordetella genomosp. 1 TaxID=1395607 RepID=UPI001178B598|nr:hypothetical protein [Bordetella genomosp. 1]